MLRFIAEKVLQNKRRVAVIESLDLRVLRTNIQFHIQFSEKEGKTYFTETSILNRMIDDIGWPVKSDAESVKLFRRIFRQEVSKYQPSLKGRNCYSFQLKPAPNHIVQTKVLKG